MNKQEHFVTGGGVTVTLDARTVLIGHFVYNVSASDNEEDDITFSLICTPSGCPFTIYNSISIFFLKGYEKCIIL